MSRWLRALVIALLLPAYCWAAIGVDVVAPVQASVQDADALRDGLPDPTGELVSELGDTSDDAAELPTRAAAVSSATLPAAGLLPAPDARPPVNTPDRLLRPPRATRQP